MRYRGSNSNNPNLMYQDECDRRMRSSSRGNFARNSRDGDRSASSSFRGRSRDQRNSSNSQQYQSYSSGGGGYNSRSSGGGQDQSSQPHGQFNQPPPNLPPPSGGPQPLMAQQFAPSHPPLMGFMGQTPYPFASPPPPPGPPPPRK